MLGGFKDHFVHCRKYVETKQLFSYTCKLWESNHHNLHRRRRRRKRRRRRLRWLRRRSKRNSKSYSKRRAIKMEQIFTF